MLRVDEESNYSGVMENVDFQGFRTQRLRRRHLLNDVGGNCESGESEANIIIQHYFVPCHFSTDPKMHDIE